MEFRLTVKLGKYYTLFSLMLLFNVMKLIIGYILGLSKIRNCKALRMMYEIC